jgi:prepilin-type N-terminal cleavage/methylation domain-containing protein
VTRGSDVHDPEAGFTLSEVLAALIILSIAIAAIVAAMGSSIIASDTHRKIVSDDAILRSYAEQIQAAAFVECAQPPSGYAPFADPGGAYGPKFQVSIVSIDYWDGNAASTTPAFTAACTAQTPGAGLQRITLESYSTSGRGGHQHLQIMKRRS